MHQISHTGAAVDGRLLTGCLSAGGTGRFRKAEGLVMGRGDIRGDIGWSEPMYSYTCDLLAATARGDPESCCTKGAVSGANAGAYWVTLDELALRALEVFGGFASSASIRMSLAVRCAFVSAIRLVFSS